MNPTLDDCLDAAVDALLGAWARVRHYHRGEFEVFHKPDGPATDADREADRAITDALLPRFPREAGVAYLTEEHENDAHRLDADRVWVIDPIDGTKYFIDGSGEFAMIAGLLERRGEAWQPVVGVVYHPPAGLLYTAREGAGAWVHQQVAEPAPGRWREAFAAPERLRVNEQATPALCHGVFSGSRRPSPRLVATLERLEPAGHRRMGSLGLKVMEVAAGRADYYVNPELGKTMEWDVAGPAAILIEAGGAVADLAGRDVPFNAPEPRLPGGLLAASAACLPALVELLGREPAFGLAGE
jgi:3'(2'), 5'-bisphosphate nucleotidase